MEDVIENERVVIYFVIVFVWNMGNFFVFLMGVFVVRFGLIFVIKWIVFVFGILVNILIVVRYFVIFESFVG